ncbi:endoplasmic reticulum vesicle transporter-domain-containing protein [Pyronema omphalodes]|nr:endoplasmic reticulum vesicle transporter-domain-containing protein [Pyronema omphalodes]
MARSSRLTRLDAFSKTVEDARIKTTSGGIVTLISVLVVMYLIAGEVGDYRRIEVVPELIVDKSRGEQLPISLNITFPHMPCNLLTLDVMDVSGEQQSGVTHGVHLTRLSKFPESLPIDTTALDLHADEAPHLAPDYCGECYGANPPEGKKCCNTCTEVREAYEKMGWAFGLGEGVTQCEREHYGEHIKAMSEEGCNIAGHLQVNKVVGNFHFAPGKSFSTPQMHVHDLQQFFESPKEHKLTHTIHHLSFGPDLPVGEVSHNPLDGATHEAPERAYNYMYFIKVVSTSFLPLGVEAGQDGAIETHQYSVTSHERSLQGGTDKEHPNTLHARGGIPGVFFSYDISPMKVINREVRQRTFVGLLTGICAIIGGTLTVATLVDRTVYEGLGKMKKMHEG